jgi:hypothetical protein
MTTRVCVETRRIEAQMQTTLGREQPEQTLLGTTSSINGAPTPVIPITEAQGLGPRLLKKRP